MAVLRHYCLLRSHISEPRWAAIGAGDRVADTLGASAVAYATALARLPQEPHVFPNVLQCVYKNATGWLRSLSGATSATKCREMGESRRCERVEQRVVVVTHRSQPRRPNVLSDQQPPPTVRQRLPPQTSMWSGRTRRRSPASDAGCCCGAGGWSAPVWAPCCCGGEA